MTASSESEPANFAPSYGSDRAEIERYLAEDPTRLGDVYRGLQQELDADEIAEDLGVSTSGFVWNHSPA